MLNPLDMTGRRILVTGASSGIGRETAILLSHLGAGVILVGRDRQRLERTFKCLEGTGHAVEEKELGAYEDIPAWMRRIVSSHGALDGLVHSAGLQLTAALKVMEASQVESLWGVNVSAGIWLAKGYRQRGVHNPGGAIVFMASAIGLVGGTALSAYSASKGAVIALTRSLANDLAPEQIRVNCLAPGLVKTEMFREFSSELQPDNLAALERDYLLGFGEPTDVASAAAFLLSSAARWITGSVLVVDGGLTAH